MGNASESETQTVRVVADALRTDNRLERCESVAIRFYASSRTEGDSDRIPFLLDPPLSEALSSRLLRDTVGNCDLHDGIVLLELGLKRYRNPYPCALTFRLENLGGCDGTANAVLALAPGWREYDRPQSIYRLPVEPEPARLLAGVARECFARQRGPRVAGNTEYMPVDRYLYRFAVTHRTALGFGALPEPVEFGGCDGVDTLGKLALVDSALIDAALERVHEETLRHLVELDSSRVDVVIVRDPVFDRELREHTRRFEDEPNPCRLVGEIVLTARYVWVRRASSGLNPIV